MDKEADKVTHLPKNICHGGFWSYNMHFQHVRLIQDLKEKGNS